MTELYALLSDPFTGGICFFILGLLLGSFYNVCILRLPLEESVVHTPSHCPQCKNNIPWYLNIPVFSYVFLIGKCKFCKKKISIQYPLVELTSGLLFYFLFNKFGLSFLFLSYAVFCSALLIVSVIDLHHRIIPNEISLPGILVGFAFCFLAQNILWWESILGFLIGGGVFFGIAYLYEKFAKREGLGGGDIKLLAMIGAWLGYQSILIVIVISSLVGSVVGIALMLTKNKNLQTAIPFGPFLAAAAILYVFLGHEISLFLFPPL